MVNNSTNQSRVPENELSSTMEVENKQEFNDDDLIIIWLDDCHRTTTNDLMETCPDLRGIINNLQLFDDVNKCIDYITSIQSNIHVFLILSSHQSIISLFHQLPQIKFIYIFNINKTGDGNNYVRLVKDQNIFNDKQSLIEELTKDVGQLSKHLSTPMTFFNNVDGSIKEKSLKDLSKESQDFMYTDLFREVLLRHSQSNKAKDDLLDECRQSCYDNESYLKLLDQFKKEYNANEAIRWYTRDSFLYRLLNKALRYQDFYAIYKFRYIIKDLHEQLKHLYFDQSSELKNIKTVYRGQLMHKSELENLHRSQGGLVSMNSFLSTTQYKTTASTFILGATKGETVPVLFEININDISSTSTPYANIEKYSQIRDEQEILFSMNCVFQIDSVEECPENNQTYFVKLTLTNQYEEENGLKQLTNYIRMEIEHANELYALGYLMMEMAHYDEAKRFYELLQKDLPSHHPQLATISNNLGTVHYSQGRYAEALTCFKETLNIQSKSWCNYAAAVNYYVTALEIQSKSLPENDPDIVRTYWNLGNLYSCSGNKAKALEEWQTALDIASKSLPSSHRLVARLLEKLATARENE
ncbi:unnamed protein product [Rotaria sp. Silwood1]|nr:unnamed protein product [Rotaria sp. Silwood1]